MGPVHTTQRGQRFRYYVTHQRKLKDGDPAPYRLSAVAVETICCELLGAHLRKQVSSIEDHANVDGRVATLVHGDHNERCGVIIERVCRVTIGDGSLTLLLNDGTTFAHSMDRIRLGNDAKLVIDETRTAVINRPPIRS